MALAIATITLPTVMNDSITRINLGTSAPALAVTKDDLIWVDRECMRVQARVNGVPGVLQVLRGWAGTAATPHKVGAKTYFGAPRYFKMYNQAGAATPALVDALPWINTYSGDAFDAPVDGWEQVTEGGVKQNITFPT